MNATRIASLQTEWTDNQYLARYLLRRRLRREDVGTEAMEETLAEATAHAWQAFTKIRQGRPEIPAVSAIRLATRTAASRVKTRCRFVPKSSPCYVDALDRPQRGLLADVAQHESEEPSLDISWLETLANLPDDIRPIARLLSQGIAKNQIALRLQMSKATLWKRLAKLRQALS